MNQKTFRVADAHKLEDPERLVWLPPGEAVRLLDPQPGMQIADVGAGTGYFALPFAATIGPTGTVWAVDGQQGMLDILQGKLETPGSPANIKCQLGTASQTGLLSGICDIALLANIWHELDQQDAVLLEMARILRPGGRLAILDWRKDRAQPPGPPPEHRISASETAATLASQGWRVLSSHLVGQFSYLTLAVRDSEAR
jgi:ubiquinone/menaquinone biosynthesis C-methylase UbiE